MKGHTRCFNDYIGPNIQRGWHSGPKIGLAGPKWPKIRVLGYFCQQIWWETILFRISWFDTGNTTILIPHLVIRKVSGRLWARFRARKGQKRSFLVKKREKYALSSPYLAWNVCDVHQRLIDTISKRYQPIKNSSRTLDRHFSGQNRSKNGIFREKWSKTRPEFTVFGQKPLWWSLQVIRDIFKTILTPKE